MCHKEWHSFCVLHAQAGQNKRLVLHQGQWKRSSLVNVRIQSKSVAPRWHNGIGSSREGKCRPQVVLYSEAKALLERVREDNWSANAPSLSFLVQ